MAMSQSAVSELLEAFRTGEGVNLIHDAVQAALQDLIEAEATSVVGAGRYERTTERTTQRNGSRPRTLTTTAGDLQLRIPKLRKGTFFPSILEPRRRIDQALYAVVMEAYVNGVSTRAVDDLVAAMGSDTGISKSEVSRICAGLDEMVAAFRTRTLGHTEFPYVFLDATYLHVREASRGQVVSQAVVVATGVTATGGREILGLDVGDSEKQALKGINMPIYDKKVTALIGPSGCGKSTYLRSFNRMHDLYPGNRYEGEIRFFPDNTNLLSPDVDPIEVRMRIGMVFQKPNPFPKTIFENVAYGLRVRGENNKRTLDDKVEHALKGAAIWDEVKDRLQDMAPNLSGGQQQRLCIARALATDPELLLFDEPTSALDPIATGAIEELVHELKKRVTILIVTHNMQQAARVSDYTAYMYLGEMIEFGKTDQIFIKPNDKRTEDYITGRMG